MYMSSDFKQQDQDWKSLLTATVDQTQSQIVTFGLLLGIGFTIFALNDFIDENGSERSENMDTLNLKAVTGIVMFSTFLMIYNSMVGKMNSL